MDVVVVLFYFGEKGEDGDGLYAREERREKEGARQGDRELKEAPYKTWDTGLWGPCPGAPEIKWSVDASPSY